MIYAQEAERITGTVLIASNVGTDIEIDNDDYRDQLIELFSYSSYRQEDSFVLNLERGKSSKVVLPSGYDLKLAFQGLEEDRALVQAVIRKEGRNYVHTVLSIQKPGVVFLGGPPTADGVLILVLEAGF